MLLKANGQGFGPGRRAKFSKFLSPNFLRERFKVSMHPPSFRTMVFYRFAENLSKPLILNEKKNVRFFARSVTEKIGAPKNQSRLSILLKNKKLRAKFFKTSFIGFSRPTLSLAARPNSG